MKCDVERNECIRAKEKIAMLHNKVEESNLQLQRELENSSIKQKTETDHAKLLVHVHENNVLRENVARLLSSQKTQENALNDKTKQVAVLENEAKELRK
jgi:hypothetical protein